MTHLYAIEFFVAVNLLVVGISHFLQPGIWIAFFAYLYEQKNAGNIINALIALGFGSFITAFHWVWVWPKALITLYGLLLVLKGFVYLIYPQIGLASIKSVAINGRKKFKLGGLVMFLFALGIFYNLTSTSSI